MRDLATVPIRRLSEGEGLFSDGDWIETPYITDEGVRLIQTGNIGRGVYREQGFRFVSDETFEKLSCTEVKPRDVLICRLADPVGRSCLAPDLGTRMITSVDVAILRPNPSIADPRYVNYFCSSRPYLDYVDSIARGGTRQRISRDQLGSVPIKLPDLPTQRQIADFLDVETERLDSLIQRKRLLSSLLDERRMALMTEAVRGSVSSRNMATSELPWIDVCSPDWPVAKLSLVARLGSGHTPSREHPEWWENCTIPWVTTGEVAQMRDDRIEFIEVTREMVSEAGIAHSSAELHPAGTVVLCRTASAGYSAIMARPMATSQDFATWTCGPSLRPRFLLLCLRVMRQDLLGRLAMGSTHKTIYMPDIESIRVPLPPVAEQDEIVEAVWERLREIDAARDVLTKQADLLTERREAVITAAVSGELQARNGT